jgi:hypothetical protein
VKTILKITILILFFLISCGNPRLNYDEAIIPLTPVNFSEVNSYYDDYNSMIVDETWADFSLFFSTNRYSYGNDFDITYFDCEMIFNLISGEFHIHSFFNGKNSLVDSINSRYNELGPYLTFDITSHVNSVSESNKRFFYTSDKNGNNDIFYIYYSDSSYEYSPRGNPVNLAVINTGFDDGYLTIHRDEYSNRETVYFMSNRDGSFDIYRAVSEENKLINQSANIEMNKVEQLSSHADDKCPFITGNLMVFASDRDGGLGGFDLWYSVYQNSEWAPPVNFGEDINTQYNEYRPVIAITEGIEGDFLNNLMIFSSDRPGGMGGFDLYYVGVSKTL